MRRTRGRSGHAGSVMIEFTLSLAFLIPLFLGVWEFGYSFYIYSALENAIRAGGRYASTIKYDSATTTPTSSFLTAVQNMCVYGDPAADTTTAKPMVPGLATSNISLTVTFANNAPSAMTVAITGFKLPTYAGTVTLTNKPYVWFPFTGPFGPP
jgi:Flp pilus assembly protein TadG